MKIIGGKLNNEFGQYVSCASEISEYNDDNCTVQIFGNVLNGENRIDGKELFSLWKKYGYDLNTVISGIYIVALFDKNSGEFAVFHDRSSSPVSLYYTENDGILYYSSSLVELLKMSGIKRQLNEETVGDFLTNGYIVGENTLVKDVYKLKFFNCLTVENGKAIQRAVEYGIEDVPMSEAVAKWENVLENSVKSCVSGNEISSPLSSGYDSNYILYVEDKCFDLPINCFSIGGKVGRNEVPVVEENAARFEKVTLKTALTDENLLSKFPEIVRRLEGAVFECGLFLQYTLASLVNESGKEHLICGECADQVMNENYFREDRLAVAPVSKNKYYDFAEYPMAYGHYLILKKNGILCNSFGIETRYPFLDKRILPLTKALTGVNKRDKRFHVAMCERLLKPEIIANISKIGGATDVRSLFSSKDEVSRFVGAVKNTGLWKKYGGSVSLANGFYARDIDKIPLKHKIKKTLYSLLGRK